MANRQWRVTGSFLRVGEVAVIVQSPNWQGALRKGALEIKKLPQLKGRRLSKGVFTVNEQETVAETISGPQEELPMPVNQQAEPDPIQATADVIAEVKQTIESGLINKCSNPSCAQPFAHEGMCDNYVPEAQPEAKEVNGNVDGSEVAPPTPGNTNQEG